MSNSITKTSITDEKIGLLVKKAFGEAAVISDIKELKEGFFNTAYLITLEDKLKTVLKVSPPEAVTVMRYENKLMEKEVAVLRILQQAGTVPAPEVLYYDYSKEIIENQYFFMGFVKGVPLNNLDEKLNDIQKQSISKSTGLLARQISQIKSSHFGDISEDNKRFTKWSEAYMFMIWELLQDAKDKNVQLPYNDADISNMLEGYRDILDEVSVPSLVHKDLWKGNIFVEPETALIHGIIDFERAIYGDPLMEPVCGFLLDSPEFMNNFYGRTELSRNEKIRTILYRIYLFLIMVIECYYRQYPWEDSDKWAREQLGKAFSDLQNV